MTVRKLCFWSLSLLALCFTSCGKEVKQGSEDVLSVQSKEATPLYLSAEIGFEDDLRAIEFKLERVNGKSIPRPQFKDKQEVEVHTIIWGSNGHKEAKTLKWKYDALTKKLVLKGTFDQIYFRSQDKLYLSALLAPNTQLADTRVSFAGTRELHGVKIGGDLMGGLNVPYALAWTALSIETKKVANSGASQAHAFVTKDVQAKFKPLGAMIAYKLGNQIKSGNYTFLPKSMMVTSNVWGDKGTFELNPTGTPKAGDFPKWKKAPAHVMTYTFASGHSPEVISKGSVDEKIYFAWVMPNEDASDVERVTTSIVVKGDCSRPEIDGYRDYTKTYFTDYEPKSDGSKGRVTNGKIHKLTANVTNRLALPIEYVAEYNLAGSNFAKPSTGAGARGELRFADSHGKGVSGYYDYYTVAGISEGSYIHNSNTLYDEIDKTFGEENYFIPSGEHWWGVFISPEFAPLGWQSGKYVYSYADYARIGGGVDDFRLSFSSDYYAPKGEKVVYATRFGAANTQEPKVSVWRYDPYWGANVIQTYPPAQDNLLRCAYRYVYEEVEGRLRIDVAYLGDSTDGINSISNRYWWDAKQSSGEVISRTFPMAGHVLSSFTSAPRDVNKVGAYWSTSQDNQGKPWRTHFNYAILAGMNNAFAPEYGLPVRLFKAIP